MFTALCSAGWRFEVCGLDITRKLEILILASCAIEEPDVLTPPSTATIISGKGTGANLRPLANSPSIANRGLEDNYLFVMDVDSVIIIKSQYKFLQLKSTAIELIKLVGSEWLSFSFSHTGANRWFWYHF